METLHLPAHALWTRLRVNPSRDCWEFHGSTNRAGYGRIHAKGRVWLAHRLAWELANTRSAEGMFVCHHCDNPPCCNPAHLFLGTARDNNADRSRKGRSARQRGQANGRAKLRPEELSAIRVAYGEGALQRDLAERYGVGQTTISAVLRGESWAGM